MTATWCPRRASAIAVYSPVGPAPTMTARIPVPFRPVKTNGHAAGHLVSDLIVRNQVHGSSIAGDALGNRRMQADKTPASGLAPAPLNETEETACRLIHRRCAGLLGFPRKPGYRM